jgi:nucleoside-diphosphate-sugar epimerase
VCLGVAMRLAVTGAGGLLGGELLHLVTSASHSVVAIDRKFREPLREGVDYRHLDTTSFKEVALAIVGCEAVIHLAAHTSPHSQAPHRVHNENVTSSYNVMAAAISVGIKRICQASSINAIGGAYSSWPRYDYLPLDELHPTYNEDPYSLSKWVCEAQADSLSRSDPTVSIMSLRFHSLVRARSELAASADDLRAESIAARELWGYTTLGGAARACLLAVTTVHRGHSVLYAVADRTTRDESSDSLHQRFFPSVPLRRSLVDNESFFDSNKALRLLSWKDS